MYVIPELKLNKFKLVAIPKAKDLYARLGRVGLPASSSYTGDETAEYSQRKTDQIREGIEQYEQYAREQAAKQD